MVASQKNLCLVVVTSRQHSSGLLEDLGQLEGQQVLEHVSFKNARCLVGSRESQARSRDGVFEKSQVLVANRNIGDGAGAGSHDVEQNDVLVAGVKVGDDDLDAVFVVSAVGFDTEIASQPEIDALFRFPNFLSSPLIESCRADDVDQADSFGESNAKAYRPSHDTACSGQFFVDDARRFGGLLQQVAASLACERQSLDFVGRVTCPPTPMTLTGIPATAL